MATAERSEAGSNVDEEHSIKELRDACLTRLENTTDPNQRRLLERAIIQLTFKINPDEIDGLFGVRVVERAEERPTGERCIGYVLGNDVDGHEVQEQIIRTYVVSQVPVSGAVAIYFLNDMDQASAHIGRVTERGTVISKWDLGPVYEHQPDLVPLNYGDPLYFIPPVEVVES